MADLASPETEASPALRYGTSPSFLQQAWYIMIQTDVLSNADFVLNCRVLVGSPEPLDFQEWRDTEWVFILSRDYLRITWISARWFLPRGRDEQVYKNLQLHTERDCGSSILLTGLRWAVKVIRFNQRISAGIFEFTTNGLEPKQELGRFVFLAFIHGLKHQHFIQCCCMRYEATS